MFSAPLMYGTMPMHGGMGQPFANRGMHPSHLGQPFSGMTPGPPLPGPSASPSPFGKRPGMQPNHPPPSHYAPEQKQENPEYASLEPGAAKTIKGYKGPISDKGRELMETYERVMKRPQGSFPTINHSSNQGGRAVGAGAGAGAGPTARSSCHFFKSPQGCRNGGTCHFSHDACTSPAASKPSFFSKPAPVKAKCRYYPNCTLGAKCRFLHPQ